MQLSRLQVEGIGAVLVTLLGALFHFTYQWSGNSPVVASFSATDESVMQHMRLLHFPWLLMTLVIWAVGREVDDADVWLSRALGLTAALLVIPAVYYSYTVGATRSSILPVDLITFVVAIVVGAGLSWFLSTRLPRTRVTLIVGLLLHLAIFGVLVSFGYWRPIDYEPFRVRGE